jgi:hypothetical protein
MFGTRVRINFDAIASLVHVVGGMERLMQIADKMDQERQIACRTPLVVVPSSEATREFVDLSGDTIAIGTSFSNVDSRV